MHSANLLNTFLALQGQNVQNYTSSLPTPAISSLLCILLTGLPLPSLASLQARARMTFTLKHKSAYVIALFETLQTFPISLDSLESDSQCTLRLGHSSRNCCIALHCLTVSAATSAAEPP